MLLSFRLQTKFMSQPGVANCFGLRAGRNGAVKERGRITVGRHPSALLLNRDGSRLFVASPAPTVSQLSTQKK